MSFLSVLLGALVGGAISGGAIIGITFLGALVPWWALLLIAVGGTFIGGFIGGLLAKGAGAGFLAGLLSALGLDPSTGIGLSIHTVIVDKFIAYGSDINDFANAYFPVFGLIIGAIFGGLAAIVNGLAGLIGGSITRKKKDDYDSYY